MTIEELREQKRLLEAALRAVISTNLKAFSDTTGCSVKGVEVRFVSLRNLESFVAWQEVSDVRVEIETGL